MVEGVILKEVNILIRNSCKKPITLKPILLTPTYIKDLPGDKLNKLDIKDTINDDLDNTLLIDLWEGALIGDKFKREILGLLRNRIRFLKKIPLI